MRTFFYIFQWAVLAHAFSCGKDPAFQLPAGVYSIARIYDIGNSSSSADLRIEGSFLTSVGLTDLVEARLVIVKASKSFSQNQVSNLLTGNFFSIPLSNSANQVIKPAGTNDSDGDPIVNDTPYQIYIAILGKQGSRQLSSPKDITLMDRPPLAGDYVGSWEDLGPPGPGTFPMSLRIADDYSGKMFYASATFKPYSTTGAQDATTTMVVSGNTISSFSLNQLILGYSGSGAAGGTPTPNCPASNTLTGHVEDDINLVFDTFNWTDCDGSRNVKLKFTRQ